MDNSISEFSDEEREILAGIEQEEAPQAEPQEPQPEPQASAPGQATATPPAEMAAAEQPPEQPAAEPQQRKAPQGDTRAALRASRQAERDARRKAQEAEQRARELEERIGVLEAKQANELEITDEELAEVANDIPVVGKLAKRLRELEAAQAKAKPEPAHVEDDFTPPAQPDAVQDAIDGVPELLAWQNDRDQTRFSMAVQADAFLRTNPAWANRSLEERFAEAVRRVNAELAPATPPTPQATPRRNPQEVIEQAPVATPKVIADFRGGASPQPTTPDYSRMTDEEVMASLG